MSGNDSFVDALIGRIAVSGDAANDNASTGGPYRVVIEHESDGREFVGWGGISRERAEAIVAFVNNRCAPDIKIGRLPPRPNMDGLARNRKRYR